MNSLISILALSIPVFFTGIVALYFKLNQSLFKLVLAFSAAYLFSTTIMHLLPEAYQLHDGFHTENFKMVGLFIVIGFSAQLLMEKLSAGLEHGHSHQHTEVCTNHFPYGIIIGLLIHSFLEGLPVYVGDTKLSNHQLILGLGIHNIPISFLFVALLKDHKVKTPTIVFFLFLFSMMAPFGYFFSYLVHTFEVVQVKDYQYIADSIVIGIFLFISTAILFETSEEHKYSPSKIISMLLGIVLAFILS
ncbi:MAG: ZIP family metal transporter [Bacteroidota bacterium]|nr:ZIP family metal transporter [Bacteroidota bacterium]